MRNKFPGTCYRCGTRVEVGEGHFERLGRIRPVVWRTQHADCAIKYRGYQMKPGEVLPRPSKEAP